MSRPVVLAVAAGTALAASSVAVRADDVHVDLNFNFNGMAHAGEQGVPDSLTGYRSISDRGLLVAGGAGQLGTAPIVGATGLPYTLESSSDRNDLVMLGDRGPGTGWPYDTSEDADAIGIQPEWDTAAGFHKNPETSSGLNIPLHANSEIGFLYQISNGGGSFQVLIEFSDSTSVTVTLAGPDWFNTPAVAAGGAGVKSQTRLGGATTKWPAVQGNDAATTAPVPASSLSVFEGVISVSEMIADGLGNHAGKRVKINAMSCASSSSPKCFSACA